MSNQRETPANELDFQFMLTEPRYGSEVDENLAARLWKVLDRQQVDQWPEAIDQFTQATGAKPKTSEDWRDVCEIFMHMGGQFQETGYSVWSMLQVYVQDLRLGNISEKNGQYEYCRYWLNRAVEALNIGLPKTFLSCYKNLVTEIELSQSKDGFLREIINTVIQRMTGNISESQKKTLFGGSMRK